MVLRLLTPTTWKMETIEENRENKLQAGKDALLAFQKKKDKKAKKSKKSKHDTSSNQPLDCSTTNDSIADLPNDTPIVNGSTQSITVHNDTHLLETSLVAMETTLGNREKEIAELKSQHVLEIDTLLVQQEKIRDELLKEQAMKFAKEINEMKEKMSTLQDNEDEMEAMRIRDMKNKLKQIHEQELERVQLTHQQEKAVLIQEYERKTEQVKTECEQRLESNKVRLEEIANDQIKDIHTQFMSSYNELMVQKTAADEENRKMNERLQQAEESLARAAEEKRALCDKVKELEDSHTMEVDAARNTSLELEKRLQKWKEKASHLQQRIEETEEHMNNTDTLKHQLQLMEDQHTTNTETIDKLETTIMELKTQLNEEKLSFESKLLEVEEAHRSTLSQMETEHSEQLESSITESSTQAAASLEFAEVHMKELQQQLNAYRNQEMSHKMALEKAQQDQAREVERMRVLGEEQCEQLREQHKVEMEEKRKVMDQLEQRLKSQEDKMADQQVQMKTALEQTVEKVRIEHGEHLKKEHQQEIDDLKTHHNQQMAMLEQAKQQLEADKQNEIEHLQQQNKIIVQQVKELEERNEQQNKSHDSVVMSSDERMKEVRTLQEKLHKLETEFRAKEVQLSLTESELTNEQQKHSKTKESLEQSTKKCDDVITAMKGLKRELEEERETSMKRFEEMLQVKEDEVATHQSRLVSSQLRIGELTDELAEERRVSESLRNDITVMTNQQHGNDELERVHDELKQAKERCDTLVEEWKKKESNTERLKMELSSVQDSLTNQNEDHLKVVKGLETQVTELSDNMANASAENEQLKKEIDELVKEREEILNREAGLRSHVQVMEEKLQEQTTEHEQVMKRERTSMDLLQQDKQTVIEEMEEVKEQLAMKMKESEELSVKVNELQVELLQESHDDSQRYDELETKLRTTQEMLRKTNADHQRELMQAEERYIELEKKFNQTQRIESKMNTLLNSQSDVEKSLVKARQVLIEKLRQKELLEKDLNHHRTQLEKRQSEKQRLEELLFEKSKFEQELRNQREQLQFDLDTIEKKMKSNQQPDDSL